MSEISQYLENLSHLDRETLRRYHLETMRGNEYYNVTPACVFIMYQKGLITLENFQYVIR